MQSSRLAWTTGSASANRTDIYAAVGGTDLGIMWDDGNNEILSIWGDTFSDNVAGVSGGQGKDWRNNVLARSNNWDYQSRGLITNWWNTDKTNHARQIIPKDQFGTEYTIIPTSGIAINDRQYVWYMAVDHWGSAGQWVTQYGGFAWSDDYGKTWTKDGGARWYQQGGNVENFQMIALARPSDARGTHGTGGGYLYMYGTPNGRFGAARLARVPESSILDFSTHQQWNGTAWVNDRTQAINMIPAPVGELSVFFHVASNQWMASYYHSTLNAIVICTAPNVTGPWSSPNIVASATDYPGLYGFFFHPWSMWFDQNPCASMSQWPPYETALMQVTGVTGVGSTPVGVSKLNSAQGYANNFNAVSTDDWCGSNNIFPVRASDGRKLWISGMSYAGSLTSARARPLNYQTVMNTVLEERDVTITPYESAFTDSVGRKHLFDSRQIPDIPNTSPVRLDPVTGFSMNGSLFLTLSWSATNYTYPYLYDFGDTVSGSSMILVEIPLTALSSGICSIRKSVVMPSTPILGARTLNFGSGIYAFDEQYVYIAGRASVGNVQGSSGYWHTYLARVPQIYFEDVTYVPRNMEYFSYLNNQSSWDPDVSQATPIFKWLGPDVDIRRDVDGFYHYLVNQLGYLYGLRQEVLVRDSTQIPYSWVALGTIPADAGATQFSTPCVYDVGWADLVSGNRLASYTVVQTNQSWEQQHPTFSRPHFFEYNALTATMASPLYVPPA